MDIIISQENSYGMGRLIYYTGYTGIYSVRPGLRLDQLSWCVSYCVLVYMLLCPGVGLCPIVSWFIYCCVLVYIPRYPGICPTVS